MRHEALQAAVKEAVRDGAVARLRTTAPRFRASRCFEDEILDIVIIYHHFHYI